jgi:ABC-type sugar transport systems, permease components
MAAVLVDHAADGAAVHHARGAVPRHRELQDVRHGQPAHRGRAGSTTEVASITLKRAAFESWRTGYSSAFAIILFVTVFGLANIYVKALNRVKSR